MCAAVAQRCHHITQQHSVGYCEAFGRPDASASSRLTGCFAVGYWKSLGFKVSLQVPDWKMKFNPELVLGWLVGFISDYTG